MLFNILWLIVGTALVLWGADRFTDGASAVARRWKVSEMVIGLTIVSMGTSLPEFMVSFFSSLRGSSDMSLGNILGSNIFNTLIIVGASAMMMCLNVSRSLLWRDIPICLFISLLLFGLCLDNVISILDGAVLSTFFCLYLYYTYRIAMKERNSNEGENVSQEDTPLWKISALLIVGILCLVFGGRLLVNNAADLARMWGVSESVIGLTILAGGTSLPELATSIVAARKGSEGLALGNVVGSNIFNATFVLGSCALISPLHIQGITNIDWMAFICSVVILWLTAFTGKKLNQKEGLFLLLCYVVYLLFLLQ